MRCNTCHRSLDDLSSATFCPDCGVAVELDRDPMIGSLVGGRYRLKRLIAEGGMGRVYEAEQSMGTAIRKVAVKILHGAPSDSRELVARFFDECATTSELEHPNIVSVYDFGQIEGGDLYLAMELVRGESLRELLNRGRVPPTRTAHILLQIASALDEAHRKGIVHRDLKPENVLLTQVGNERDFVKVVDFGIARRPDHLARRAGRTRAGVLIGSPGYMSPEQCQGLVVDPRSDIYALGLLGYEMLAGQRPFLADTDYDWVQQHVSVEPTPLSATPGATAPEPMRRAIERAIQKRPADRQASVREFADELRGGAVATAPRRSPVPAATLPMVRTAYAEPMTPPVVQPTQTERPVARAPASPVHARKEVWWLAGIAALVAVGGTLFAIRSSLDRPGVEAADEPPRRSVAAPVQTAPSSQASEVVTETPKPASSPTAAPKPAPKPVPVPAPVSTPSSAPTTPSPVQQSPTALEPSGADTSAAAPGSSSTAPNAPIAPAPSASDPPRPVVPPVGTPSVPPFDACIASIAAANAGHCEEASELRQRCPDASPNHAAAHEAFDRQCKPHMRHRHHGQ